MVFTENIELAQLKTWQADQKNHYYWPFLTNSVNETCSYKKKSLKLFKNAPLELKFIDYDVL